MQQVLLVVQILVGIGLVGVVLIQHGRGADAGAAFGGGGGAGSVFGARGPGTLLTRVTAILATVFFLNSLGLAYAARQQSLANRSVMEQFDGAAAPQSSMDVPASGAGNSESGASDVPSAPAAASGSDTTSDLPTAPAAGSETTENKDN